MIPFLEKIKVLGYKVKVDTNGYRPDVLKELIDLKLVDYLAMDVKNNLDGYHKTTGLSLELNKILESIALVKASGLDYELRTTWMKAFHDMTNVAALGDLIKGAKICVSAVSLFGQANCG